MDYDEDGGKKERSLLWPNPLLGPSTPCSRVAGPSSSLSYIVANPRYTVRILAILWARERKNQHHQHAEVVQAGRHDGSRYSMDHETLLLCSPALSANLAPALIVTSSREEWTQRCPSEVRANYSTQSTRLALICWPRNEFNFDTFRARCIWWLLLFRHNRASINRCYSFSSLVGLSWG